MYNTKMVVTSNKNVQGGVPCFAGTRVPVSSLFDHLKRGYSIQVFVADFPTVRVEQVIELLDLAEYKIAEHASLS